MDIDNPLRSLAPVVDSDVLAVLHRTPAPLTGARVARLADRSETQVREVLRRLDRQGLVRTEHVGHAYTYALNREHVLVAALDAAFASSATVEHRVAELLASWAPQPAAVILFGSFARGEADPDSDVDLLIVRPDDLDSDDDRWTQQRYELSRRVEAWTGNPAQVVELSAVELAQAVEQDQPLIASLRADGRLVVGDVPALRRLPTTSSPMSPRRRSGPRTQDCTAADARTRLDQARLYLEVAELILDAEAVEAATVATGNAVLAAIAAADAISCATTGTRFRGQDHRGAADHLEDVTGDRGAAGLLRDTVNLKDAGHHGLSNVRGSQARSAVRKASQLVAMASDMVR